MKYLTLSFILAASMFTTNSYADERQFIGTVGGGALGAIVGNHISGTPGAVVGGVAGAYVGHEITKPAERRDVVYVKESRPSYHNPQPVYYQQAPQPVYVEEHRHWRHEHWRHEHHHDRD